MAGVSLLRRRHRHHVDRHGARPDCRRHPRDGRPINGRIASGRHCVSGRGLQPVSSIAETIGSLQQALVSARRVRDIFALSPEKHDAPGALDASTVSGLVRFDHVSFSYDEDHRVLRDVTFDARPGEMVAVVGLTGAGKRRSSV